jgi:hypothetical protein
MLEASLHLAEMDPLFQIQVTINLSHHSPTQLLWQQNLLRALKHDVYVWILRQGQPTESPGLSGAAKSDVCGLVYER